MKKTIFSWGLVLSLPFLVGFNPFETSNDNVEEGNAKLGAGKVKEALKHYQEAAKELPDEPGVLYNLGIAQFKLGQFDKARQALVKATLARKPSLKARAFFNLGNAHFQLKQYKEAAAAYRRSLQLNPGHDPSKWNLELSLRRIKEEEKKKNQNKDKKNNKNKQDNKKQKQDQKKQSSDQKKQKQDQKKKDPQQQDQKKKNPQQQKKQPQPQQKKQKPNLDKQRMNSVLDALDKNNKKLQRQRARMAAPRGYRPAKDW